MLFTKNCVDLVEELLISLTHCGLKFITGVSSMVFRGINSWEYLSGIGGGINGGMKGGILMF